MDNKYIIRHFFQIPPYILIHLLVFGTPEGSPNTSKICQNIRRYLAEKRLLIYKCLLISFKISVLLHIDFNTDGKRTLSGVFVAPFETVYTRCCANEFRSLRVLSVLLLSLSIC